MKDIFYNVAIQDISNGLKNFEISSAQDYFILLEAPTNANITVRLNSVTAHEIPIKENWQFESADVNKMFISCDPIEGAYIKYGQADGNLIIRPNPTINKIDLINRVGMFESALLEQLDKIINQYDFENSTFLNGSSTASTETILLNSVCVHDKIIVSLTPPFSHGGVYGAYSRGYVFLKIDNKIVAYVGSSLNGGDLNFNSNFFEFEGIKGKNIQISARSWDTNFESFYSIQQINRKA